MAINKLVYAKSLLLFQESRSSGNPRDIFMWIFLFIYLKKKKIENINKRLELYGTLQDCDVLPIERNNETIIFFKCMREKERYLLFVFLSWHFSNCVFSCRWLLLVLYSLSSRARIFFLYTMIKKEFLAAFYRPITSLFFSVIVIQKHYRIRVWKITFWFWNSLDLVVVMIYSLHNPVSKFIAPKILCISPNTENRYSVGGTISSTTSVKNINVVIKQKHFHNLYKHQFYI